MHRIGKRVRTAVDNLIALISQRQTQQSVAGAPLGRRAKKESELNENEPKRPADDGERKKDGDGRRKGADQYIIWTV